MGSFASVILMRLDGHGQVRFPRMWSNYVLSNFCDFTVVFLSSLRSCAYEVQSSLCEFFCVRPMTLIAMIIFMYGLYLFLLSFHICKENPSKLYRSLPRCS